MDIMHDCHDTRSDRPLARGVDGPGQPGMTADTQLEMSLRAGRDHRGDMARWLALELLMTDPMALQDNVLQDRLILLQDKIEAKIRAAVAWDSPAESAASPLH